MMVKNLQFILLILLYTKLIYATESATDRDKKNLSYTSAIIEILPLLELPNYKKSSVDQNIIFVHLPKTGGTNLVYAIDANRSISSYRFSVPRVEGRSPNLITKSWIGGLATLKNECVNNQNECKAYRFISGHFPYGTHSYLKGKCDYVTLVRSPIDREISSVNFDYQRGYIKNKQEAVNYLLHVMIDNPQTRLLAGEEYMVGDCDYKTLEVAKYNIRKNFLLVGITEDTDIFIQALLSIMRLEPIAISRSQVTSRKIFGEISEDLRNQLIKKHKYDILLYEYAKQSWYEWKVKNIKSFTPISLEQKILTILPKYAKDEKINYMTPTEIELHNSKFSADSLIEIEQQ